MYNTIKGTLMKYVFAFGLLFFNTAILAMTNELNAQKKQQMSQIVSHAKALITQHTNPELLKIANKTQDPEQKKSTQIISDIKNFHACQPSSIGSYIKGLKKCPAYLQLLRTSSLYVRKQAELTLPIEEQECAPVDSLMWDHANGLWPLASIQYDCEEYEATSNDAYAWAQQSLKNLNLHENEIAKRELSALKAKAQAFGNLKVICKDVVEEACTPRKIRFQQES